MGFWDRISNNQPAAPAAEQTLPAPEPPPTPPVDKIDRLADAVAAIAENQLRTAQPSAPASAAPSLPQIPDISEAEMDRIYEEGTAAQVREAENIRRNAMAERLRREMGGQLQAFQAQGVAALNKLTKNQMLRDHPHYTKDRQFKADADALIQQVESSGAMLTDESLQWILEKTTGAHHQRLVAAEAEAIVRRQREQSQTAPGGGGSANRGQNLPPDLSGNYGLPDDALMALSHLNRGRGRTPDEFAQELPARRIRAMDVNPNGKFVERVETRRYATFGDTLKDKAWADKELARQHAIMTGEISPMTPITKRDA